MDICVAIFLRVLAVYLAMAIFNAINIKRALDIVYGGGPLTWKKFKTLVRNVTCVPLRDFVWDWFVGLFRFDLMVTMIEMQKRRKARA